MIGNFWYHLMCSYLSWIYHEYYSWEITAWLVIKSWLVKNCESHEKIMILLLIKYFYLMIHIPEKCMINNRNLMILKFITSRNIMILFPSFLNLLIPICHEKYSWCLHEIWYDFHIFSKCEISDISYEFWWFRLKHFFRSLYDKKSH